MSRISTEALIRKMDTLSQRQANFAASRPPIMHLTPEEAIAQRVFTPTANDFVSCNLPCEGDAVPKSYSRTSGLTSVHRAGIDIEGYDPTLGSVYLGIICHDTRRICLTLDPRLRQAVIDHLSSTP